MQLVAVRDHDGHAHCARCVNHARSQAHLEPINTAIVELIAAADSAVADGVVIGVLDTVAYPVPTRARLLAALQQDADLATAARRGYLSSRFIDALIAQGVQLPAPVVPARIERDNRCPSCGRPTTTLNRFHCKVCTPTRVPPRRGRCPGCGRVDVRLDDHQHCGTCRRWANYRCSTCDATKGLTLDASGVRRCHRCILADELEQRAGPSPPGWLNAMHTALLASKTSAATRDWLNHSRGGRLLAELAAGTVPLTHEQLDEHPGRSVAHLRGLLIATGALEPDDRWLSRLETHIAVAIATVADPTDRRVLTSWLRWIALPRLRRRTRRGASTMHSAGNLRRQIHHITRLLAVLHDHQRTLADLRAGRHRRLVRATEQGRLADPPVPPLGAASPPPARRLGSPARPTHQPAHHRRHRAPLATRPPIRHRRHHRTRRPCRRRPLRALRTAADPHRHPHDQRRPPCRRSHHHRPRRHPARAP